MIDQNESKNLIESIDLSVLCEKLLAIAKKNLEIT
jgi:hypothetical protein